MGRPNTRGRVGPNTPSVTELHRAWLELVDTEGPFLAIPPLKRVWPQGMPTLSGDRKAALVDARKDFEAAWERFDRTPDNDVVLDSYRVARDKWIETVLRDVAGWAESLSWGAAPGIQAQSPNRAVTVTAHAALHGVDGLGALVHVVDPTDSLRQTPNDLWAATPVDRTEALLRENKVQLGIVTDGRWWGLVCAREGAMAASGIVDALTWIEESRTRDAFLALIGRPHIIGGDPTERLPVLFEESVAAAEEITEALGAQVRSAVELLIQSFSESAADADRRGLPDPLPARTHDTYEAAVTVMMRVVFLLFAEERGLLPSGELFDQGYGIARELDRLMARVTDESEEALDATSLTWHRLLATSQAVFSGASFESLRMPSYGGSLFDPERFPFLTVTNDQGTLAVAVSDRVMLHVLRSVQIADIRGEARRISFRDIDVEQIGYIYEGLLGYTAQTVNHTYVGLKGTTGAEPEIPLTTLEELGAVDSDPKKLAAAIRTWVEQDQPSAKTASANALAKALTANVEPAVVSALAQAVGDDPQLKDRVRPWLGLIRLDLRNRPFVVLPGGLMVKETPSRKNAGAHYTPRSLAEEVILHALEPLCYSPGPHQTADEAAWKLRSSDELLDLKVADIACGSGAFLVASARYLADRLVEAWIAEDPANASRKDLHTRAIRQVVANCLYGADINDMAVEMCKLSLWLVSLDRDLPFSFVDDKVFTGNSLLGITNLEQLRKLHIDPSRAPVQEMLDIFSIDIDAILSKATDLRRRLATEIDQDDPARSSAAKQRQLAQLRQTTAGLRLIADGVIAAGLPLGGKPGRPLDESYENLRVEVRDAIADENELDTSNLDAFVLRGLKPSVNTDYEVWRPLHWALEAPDIFLDSGGFDAIVGNPPYVSGGEIGGAMGSDLRSWLLNVVAGGTAGSADLSAYFVRRYAQLLNGSGHIAVIATNTLAQGATRSVGLEPLVDSGMHISRAVKSMPWPTMSASVTCSLVWMSPIALAPGLVNSDGVACASIDPLLEPEGQVAGKAVRLRENAGRAFKGHNVLGRGFVLTTAEAQEIMHGDPRSAEVIACYPDGRDDINGSPDQAPGAMIINFGKLSLEEARNYRAAFDRVEQLVLPQRRTNNRAARRDRWWQYGDYASGLVEASKGLENVIVQVIVSKAVQPSLLPASWIYNHNICVIASEDPGLLAVMASAIHQSWVIKYGGSVGERIGYNPRDVFETFPFPSITPDLRRLGAELLSRRHSAMKAKSIGLTDLYNFVNNPDVTGDPDISAVREIHAAIDEATIASYGWTELDPTPGFHEYRAVVRWSISPQTRVQVLDHLLRENHVRSSAGGAARKQKPRRRQGSSAQVVDPLF